MEITKKQIELFLQRHPEMKDRSQMAKAVEMITGVSVAKQVEAKSALRRLQEAIPLDPYGREKERKWRSERGMQSGVEIAQEARKNQVFVRGEWMTIRG